MPSQWGLHKAGLKHSVTTAVIVVEFVVYDLLFIVEPPSDFEFLPWNLISATAARFEFYLSFMISLLGASFRI